MRHYCRFDRDFHLRSSASVLGLRGQDYGEVCQPGRVSHSLIIETIWRSTDDNSMYHANAALNITTDLLVAALPVRQLWKLQIAMRQKIALLLILTLGWL